VELRGLGDDSIVGRLASALEDDLCLNALPLGPALALDELVALRFGQTERRTFSASTRTIALIRSLPAA
jgi:hypothetical protein